MPKIAPTHLLALNPFGPVTQLAADGARVHARCQDEYELGELGRHLADCPDSFTFRAGAHG